MRLPEGQFVHRCHFPPDHSRPELHVHHPIHGLLPNLRRRRQRAFRPRPRHSTLPLPLRPFRMMDQRRDSGDAPATTDLESGPLPSRRLGRRRLAAGVRGGGHHHGAPGRRPASRRGRRRSEGRGRFSHIYV